MKGDEAGAATPQADGSPALSHVLSLAFLSLAVAAAYHPLIAPQWTGCDWSQFTQEWDDRSNFLDNELVRKPLSWELLGKMHRTTRINVFEPVGWMLKALVQRLTGTLADDGLLSVDARAHRLTTLTLHWCCAVALYSLCCAVLARLDVGTRRSRAAFASIGAAVWAAHPGHVEVVAWASAQPYALAALFVLLMLRAHVGVLTTPADHRRRRFCLRLVGPTLYALATLTKSVTMPVPASVFALNLVLLRTETHLGWFSTTAAHLVPYALVTAVMVPVTLRANVMGQESSADLICLETVAQRAAKAAVTLWFCIGKAAWPAELRPHYAMKELPLAEGADSTEVVVACAATLVSLLCSLAALRADGGAVLAVWVHVVAAYLPSTGLIQHGMIQKGGDRYSYLPTLAAAPVAAFLALHVATARHNRRRLDAMAACAIGLAAIIVVGTEAHLASALAPIWQHDYALLSHSVRLDPHDWRVLDIYAELLIRNGDDQNEAPELLTRSLKTVELMKLPPSPKSVVFHGKNLVLLGKTEEGCAIFSKAKVAFPESGFVVNNAAICELLVPERRAEQGPNFRRALALAKREDHRITAQNNLDTYELWEAAGFQGRYDGALIY